MCPEKKCATLINLHDLHVQVIRLYKGTCKIYIAQCVACNHTDNVDACRINQWCRYTNNMSSMLNNCWCVRTYTEEGCSSNWKIRSSLYLPDIGICVVGLDTGVGLGVRGWETVDDIEKRENLFTLWTGANFGENGRTIIPAASSATHLNIGAFVNKQHIKPFLTTLHGRECFILPFTYADDPIIQTPPHRFVYVNNMSKKETKKKVLKKNTIKICMYM